MQIAHAITEHEGTFRFLEVDDAFCDLLRISRHDVFQKSIIDVTHEADMQHNETLLHRLIKNGTSFTICKRYKRDDGTIVRVENVVSRTLSVRGESRLVASVKALDDEARVEKLLKEARELSGDIRERTDFLKRRIRKNFRI